MTQVKHEGPSAEGPVDVLLVFADPALSPSVQPYGVSILATALRAKGLTVRVVQPFMLPDPFSVVREYLSRYCPKVVGVSFRNLDWASFHFNEDGGKHFLSELREIVRATETAETAVAIGGSGFSINPKLILDRVGGDVGFVGPSETEFAEFCDRIVRRRWSLIEAVRGLRCAFMKGAIAPEPQEQHLIGPSCLDPLALEYAKIVGGTVPLRTKAGCSLRCTYCVVPVIEKLTLRAWSDIRDELGVIIDAGAGDRVFIADGEFNLPSVERAIDICEQMKSGFGDAVRWRCYLEAGFVTAPLLLAMKEAGCVGVSLTVDSLADEPRKGFAKGTPAVTAVQAIELCLDSGVNTGVNLLFGGPRESLETAANTADIAAAFNRRGVVVMVTIGLRVYPRTPFEKLAKLPAYRQFYRQCADVDWLGVFCSPVPPRELAHHILHILEPSPTVVYTKPSGVDSSAFYRRLAVGTTFLHNHEFDLAAHHFASLRTGYPDRLEPELGLLKTEILEQFGGIAGKAS